MHPIDFSAKASRNYCERLPRVGSERLAISAQPTELLPMSTLAGSFLIISSDQSSSGRAEPPSSELFRLKML